jgi:hypothetical protein
MSVIIDSHPVEREIRVGTRSLRDRRTGRRRPGPLGTGEWETFRRRGRSPEYYQEIRVPIIENARIIVHSGIEIPCHRATAEQLRILDATFQLVPPRHLELVNQRKPQGFLMSNTTGRGNSVSYMGGLNPGVDYSSTPMYDETRLILITYGALWENRHLGICPTVLHEIGHVMTHRGEISYRFFPPARRRALEGTAVSRNPGALEALCNAYMFFLCYGSSDPAIHNFGSNPPNAQKDRITRDALRRCPAFSSLLDSEWRRRYEER